MANRLLRTVPQNLALAVVRTSPVAFDGPSKIVGSRQRSNLALQNRHRPNYHVMLTTVPRRGSASDRRVDGRARMPFNLVTALGNLSEPHIDNETDFSSMDAAELKGTINGARAL